MQVGRKAALANFIFGMARLQIAGHGLANERPRRWRSGYGRIFSSAEEDVSFHLIDVY
jgi:hypothetical protein